MEILKTLKELINSFVILKCWQNSLWPLKVPVPSYFIVFMYVLRAVELIIDLYPALHA